jgi:SAM-dependent methyltransferase
MAMGRLLNMSRNLNFGCGTNIMQGFDNLDLKDFDFNRAHYPIKNDTYGYVYSRHVLEHLREPEKVLNELHRICKPGAVIDIIVPHLNNSGAFSMLGHISYFNDRTFRCLVEKEGWRPVKGWKIIFIREEPTWFGKLIFIPHIRKKLSRMINGIYKQIYVRLEVLK